MRTFTFLALTLALVGFASATASGQGQKDIAPPRLQIKTDAEYKGKDGGGDSILKVRAVAPAGLGSQLGLNPGDVIRSITVGDNKPVLIKTPADLSRGLLQVLEATVKKNDSDKTAAIFLQILQKGEKEKMIEGAIIRTEFFDRVDGATLYYFRPQKGASKASRDKKAP